MTKREKRSALHILKKARQLLVEEGWIQGALSSPDGFCVLGALWESSSLRKPGSPAYAALLGMMSTKDLATYNDRPGRTKRQVLGKFSTAIRKLEKELA